MLLLLTCRSGDTFGFMAPAQLVRIDNVGMTAFMCRRGSAVQRSTTRKFKAVCGTVHAFEIDALGDVIAVTIDRLACNLKRSGCIACSTQTALAKKIIETTKQGLTTTNV